MRVLGAASMATSVLLRRGVIRPHAYTAAAGAAAVRQHSRSLGGTCATACKSRAGDVGSSDNSSAAPQQPSWKVNLLYDSECPLCLHEVRFLEKRDVDGSIKFTDLAAPDYDELSAENGNINYEEGMKYIHAVTRDGQVIKGVEVFRRVYQHIGLGWVYAATSWPVIGPFVDWIYDIWARFRLQLMGRPALAQVLRERAERLAKETAPTCGAAACVAPQSQQGQQKQQMPTV